MTKYIRKEIRNLFIREKTIFSLIIICTFASGILINFCYGIFCNYVEKKNSSEYSLTAIDIYFDADKIAENPITKKQVEDFVWSLPNNIKDSVIMFFCRSKLKGTNHDFWIETRFTIKDGCYYPCENTRDILTRQGMLDNYFTEENEKYGEQVAIISRENEVGNGRYVPTEMMIDDKTLIIQGKSYQIIGHHDWGYSIFVPFASLDDNTVIDSEGVTLGFGRSVTRSQYNEVKAAVEQHFGSCAQMPEMKELSEFSKTVFRTSMLISGLVALSAAINLSVLYRYILLYRKKEIGILMLCGLDKKKTACCIVLECLLLFIPVFVTGIVLYHYLIFPAIRWMIPYAAGSYHLSVYLWLTAIFTLVSAVIVGITLFSFIYKENFIMELVKPAKE